MKQKALTHRRAGTPRKTQGHAAAKQWSQVEIKERLLLTLGYCLARWQDSRSGLSPACDENELCQRLLDGNIGVAHDDEPTTYLSALVSRARDLIERADIKDELALKALVTECSRGCGNAASLVEDLVEDLVEKLFVGCLAAAASV